MRSQRALIGLSLMLMTAACGTPPTKSATAPVIRETASEAAQREVETNSCVVVPMGNDMVRFQYPNTWPRNGCVTLDAAEALSAYLNKYPDKMVVQMVSAVDINRGNGESTVILAILKQKGAN